MRGLSRIFNQGTPKNACQNLPTQKNLEIENFKPPKIRSDPLGGGGGGGGLQ